MLLTTSALSLTIFSNAALAVPYNDDNSPYRCLTTERFESLNPPCIKACQDLCLKDWADGCAENDFVCHCRNAAMVSQIAQPCFSSGPNAVCSSQDIQTLEQNVDPMCAYMNQTGYAAYSSCPGMLSYFAHNGAEGAAEYMPQGYGN